MGYQESIIKVRKDYQNELINQIISSNRDRYIFCNPYFIIEVKKDIKEFNFERGDKLVYVSGERDGQRSFKDFVDNSDNQIKIDTNIENRIYSVEELQDLSLFEILDSEIDREYNEDEYFKVIELDEYIEKLKEKNYKEDYVL